MDKLFQTSSLNLVAWVLTKDIQIKEKVNIGDVTVFYFDRTDELQKAINEYNQNIELKKFITKFKQVREIIKS